MIRLIQVGMGRWGQDWYRTVVSQNKNVETTAWVEIDGAALASAQEKLNLPAKSCFQDIEEALATVEADAVLVTASLPGHVPSAQAALQARKHVLLEKPFAPTIAEAQQLVELAGQQQCTLMISQNYRFYPAARKVIELVHEQVLGPVGAVNIDFRRYANTAPIEGHSHYQLWHPLLVDMSIHHFDLIRAVSGQEPSQVFCQTWNPSWSRFVEPPSASMSIRLDGGTVVNYRGSWVSPGPQTNWAGEWSMECEGGEIVWTSRGELPDKVVLRPLGKRPRSVPLPKLEFLDRAGSLNAFIQALTEGKTPECSGRDNLKTLALMFAAIESAEKNAPVNLKEASKSYVK